MSTSNDCGYISLILNLIRFRFMSVLNSHIFNFKWNKFDYKKNHYSVKEFAKKIINSSLNGS